MSKKQQIFAVMPVKEALLAMAIPTIIAQVINLIYNMVDTIFIGRTGNPYMTAATSITLTLVMMNAALANLFGIGGGSLVARLLGVDKKEEARKASAYSFYGAAAIALTYSLIVGLTMTPLLRLLGASDATIGFAKSYTLIVIVIGALPSILSMALAHLLRNTGHSSRASIGLSMGGILNVILDPLFMFVIMPSGQEVTGAALATLLSNVIACIYLFVTYRKEGRYSPLSTDITLAGKLEKENVKALFSVGVPSALLTGLFDLANIIMNIIASSHGDLVLAGMGIVMKIQRVPNAINIGICQGMLPLVAYNYSSGNHERMKDVLNTARKSGLIVSFICIALFLGFAPFLTRLFLTTKKGNLDDVLVTIAYASLFLRIRCFASPFQLMNYHASFCMQAMGKGKETLIHAIVREIVIYIPFMFILDRIFGEAGLAGALPLGEACSAMVALWMLKRIIEKSKK